MSWQAIGPSRVYTVADVKRSRTLLSLFFDCYHEGVYILAGLLSHTEFNYSASYTVTGYLSANIQLVMLAKSGQ